MHHEDRAGVNAFIRGIDRIANEKLPAAVIMCTNRLSALHPAVRRRAAEVLSLSRPAEEQRRLRGQTWRSRLASLITSRVPLVGT
jgi:AAA+ superfamily predicted ATPase